jgi:hypothetical protein
MTTRQQLSVDVPNGSCSFQMGASAAGMGVSLTTQGAMLLDSTGNMNVQSKAPMIVQTNGGLDVLSQSGTNVHSPSAIKIYAGGGLAPGACGTGAPVSGADRGIPAQRAEDVTNFATGVVGLATAAADIKDALGESGATRAVGVLAGGAGFAVGFIGTISSGSAALSPESGEGKIARETAASVGASGKKGTTVLGSVKGAVGLYKAIKDGDPAGIATAAAGLLGAGIDAAAAGGLGGAAKAAIGAGGVDIEERASGKITMVAGNSISGMAPLGISFKTATKFSVTAGLAAKIETMAFSATAMLKATMTGYASVKMKSYAKADIEAPLVKVKAKAKATVVSPFITLDGQTNVTKNLLVEQSTRVKRNLRVDGNTTIDKKLQVKGQSSLDDQVTAKKNVTVLGQLVVKKIVTIKDDVKIKGTVKTKNIKES